MGHGELYVVEREEVAEARGVILKLSQVRIEGWKRKTCARRCVETAEKVIDDEVKRQESRERSAGAAMGESERGGVQKWDCN